MSADAKAICAVLYYSTVWSMDQGCDYLQPNDALVMCKTRGEASRAGPALRVGVGVGGFADPGLA